VLVPFVKAIVPAVDIAAGTLTVTPPVGLFEPIEDDDDDADDADDADKPESIDAEDVGADLEESGPASDSSPVE